MIKYLLRRKIDAFKMKRSVMPFTKVADISFINANSSAFDCSTLKTACCHDDTNTVTRLVLLEFETQKYKQGVTGRLIL